MKRGTEAEMSGGFPTRQGGESPRKSHIHSMSRAFVNEDTPSFDELPDRVISEHPNDVTPEGLAQIEAQLADARRAYGAAQEADDRAAMASASRDVRYWNARRGTARVAPPPEDTTQVRFGSKVTIDRSDRRRQS